MNTQTPRTDAQISVIGETLTGYASHPDSNEVVPADFARELERGNATLRDDLTSARIILQQISCFADHNLQPTPEARMARDFLQEHTL